MWRCLQQVTYYVIRMVLLVSWFWAAILTCAPILGLGLYYQEKDNIGKCVRYRNAETSTDLSYAIVYVTFGESDAMSGKYTVFIKHQLTS